MANLTAKDSELSQLDADGSGTDVDPFVPAAAVRSVIPGVGATNLGKAIDSPRGGNRHGRRDARQV